MSYIELVRWGGAFAKVVGDGDANRDRDPRNELRSSFMVAWVGDSEKKERTNLRARS